MEEQEIKEQLIRLEEKVINGFDGTWKRQDTANTKTASHEKRIGKIERIGLIGFGLFVGIALFSEKLQKLLDIFL